MPLLEPVRFPYSSAITTLVRTQCQRMGVVPVGRDHAIRGADGFHHACKHGLLADVQMAESTELLLDVEVSATLLEAAHEQHIAVPLHIRGFREGGLGRLSGR